MKKNIQIPAILFYQMALYIMDHQDSSDRRYQAIMNRVDKKMEAMKRHDLYTTYKSAASLEEKETSRKQYLDSAGISSSFRW